MTLLWRILAIAVLSVREASGASSWKTDHSVTGLPTLDGAPLTSYAGVVPVRKDHYTEVDILQTMLINRVACSTGFLKLNNQKKIIRRYCYGSKEVLAHQAA